MKKSPFKLWLKRIVIFLVVLAIAAGSWYFIRPSFRPGIPEPGEAIKARAKNVTIMRDKWGVPHIHGRTDPDTAFGLAYAHAEDDFPTIQAALAAARGRLALIMPSKLGLINDYLVNLLQLERRLEEQYPKLRPETKALMDAYADGLNYYAYLHPDEVDTRLLPFTGKDVGRGFLHKLPLFVGVGKVLQDLFARDKNALTPGRPMQQIWAGMEDPLAGYCLNASNAHAVGPSRSADNITRININSHQPWTGPAAWYEAHLISDTGWNMLGGTFPGGPVIFHGHNEHLGWAHTVNHPDLIDVYQLEMNPDGSLQYKMDGEWLPLKKTNAALVIDLYLFNWTINRDVYESVHGPVLKLHDGYYAIRYGGIDQHLLAVEQWYRMNKAQTRDEWVEAMSVLGIPMMNTVYADRENIAYHYNAALPIRKEGHDYLTILPGNTSETLWSDYYPFDKLPSVVNPPSGLVFNTNTTPYKATVGPGNPDQADFSKTSSIDTRINNRALRSLELFGTDESITREEFLEYKFDQAYSKDSAMFKKVLEPLFKNYTPMDENEKKGMQLLQEWDGVTDENSVGATLANLTFEPILATLYEPYGSKAPSPEQTFKAAVAFLIKNFGRVDVPLKQVQRLRRGSLDLGLGGGADTLNCVHTKEIDGRRVGYTGDSYILIAEFGDFGVRSWARHQYGNSSRPDSPHFADQAEGFVKRELRASFFKMDDIKANLEKSYHPGEESLP
jgi:acyl-homoserine-lactone acylase